MTRKQLLEKQYNQLYERPSRLAGKYGSVRIRSDAPPPTVYIDKMYKQYKSIYLITDGDVPTKKEYLEQEMEY